ncbi:MAG: bifunctional phosphopantothenoylcysteine decarboxylase/phosphopantothenate--cysteine ligase CoaBC [Candidatus Marinamargulisbacteria bacterium]
MTRNSSESIILGISGSISAYKSLDIIRNLRKSGVKIIPCLSESAHRFITPWTVETLAEATIVSSDVLNGTIQHLAMASNANLFVLCPTSANMLAKLANGHCNDILSAAFLSFTGPKLLFPAMHTEMWDHPITQKNVTTLRDSGVVIIPPDTGDLACGDVGAGRLPDVNVITSIILAYTNAALNLNGQRLTITSGGTHAPIDPVRAISNHASGMSGHALANIAAGFGADVTLIRTHTHPTLSTIQCLQVQTTDDMRSACQSMVHASDALLMNAAVSDFTVPFQATKHSRQHPLSITLTPTHDILAEFNEQKPDHCISVGYCLSDTDNLEALARKKKDAKGCDWMVANHSDNLGREKRHVTIISPDNHTHTFTGSLPALSVHLLDTILCGSPS